MIGLNTYKMTEIFSLLLTNIQTARKLEQIRMLYVNCVSYSPYMAGRAGHLETVEFVAHGSMQKRFLTLLCKTCKLHAFLSCDI